MDNLVSVVIPVYNREKYIERCVNSIQQQTYRNIEIIIVNDGSTDSSLSICKQLQENDNRIKLYSQENKGVSFARNVGIRNSTGTYLLFVDSDDYIEKETIQLLVDKMTENVQMVMFGVKTVTARGHIHFYSQKEGVSSIENQVTSYFEAMKGILYNGPCNKLYDNEIIKLKNIFFDENMQNAEDAIFNLDYYQYIKNISYIDNCLYNYYKHNSQSEDCYNENYFEQLLYQYNKEKYLYNQIMRNTEFFSKNQFMVEKRLFSSVKMMCLNNHVSKETYKTKCKNISVWFQSEEIMKMLENYKPNRIDNYVYYAAFKTKNTHLIYWLTKLHRNVNIIRKSY